MATLPTKRQKVDREANAAYAASQPLFDALRNATNKAGDQKIQLAKARDEVQKLHVKLVGAGTTGDAAKHEQYVHYLLKAWTSATEVYCSIFDELCKVTAANPTEGRAASDRHEQFKAMKETAAAAKKQALGFRGDETATPKRSGTKATSSLKRTREAADDEGQDAVDALAGRSDKGPRKRKKRERRTDSAQDMEETNEVAADVRPGAADRVAQDDDPTPVANGRAEEGAAATTAGKENVPEVEYEDVSAEVAARLKAKEDRKRAKKEEKKRKRESGDFALVPTVGTEKPSKKRSKVVSAEDFSGVASAETTPKRKNEKDDIIDSTGTGAKKRKKSLV